MPSKTKPDVKAQIKLDLGKLQVSNFALPAKLMGAIYAGLEYEAQNVEGIAKSTAPWHDRTGNARQGLKCVAYQLNREKGAKDADTGKFLKTGLVMGIVLFHQVPYGIFLELAHGARYRVIVPTIQEQGPEVMATLNGIMRAI